MDARACVCVLRTKPMRIVFCFRAACALMVVLLLVVVVVVFGGIALLAPWVTV